jgi:acyl-CoA synthetase (AMP-forming)/AMP-acid ligase II
LKSLFDIFRANRTEHPDATAFMIAAGDRYVPISWRQFTDDIAATAWVIRKYADCATIALLGENSYE